MPDTLASLCFDRDGSLVGTDFVLLGDRDSLIEATATQLATLKPDADAETVAAEAASLVDAHLFVEPEIAAGATASPSDSSVSLDAPAAPSEVSTEGAEIVAEATAPEVAPDAALDEV